MARVYLETPTVRPQTTIRYGALHSEAVTRVGPDEVRMELRRAEPPVHTAKCSPERVRRSEDQYRARRVNINADIKALSESVCLLHNILPRPPRVAPVEIAAW